MAAVLKPPFLSAFDPIAESEGSIDPLGLAGTYDRLADVILPGITVRMRRPRFLTTIAIGAHVCADFGRDELAADDATAPYLVFEWWVVEAFVRAAAELKESGRVPGIQKAQACVANGRPISAPGYLKTPSVFGFTGIFRRLAVRAQIVTDEGLLDESGHRLIQAWSKDQGLDGFSHGRDGSGARFRDDLRKAVTQGLRDARTSHRPPLFWQTIARYLDPSKPGRNEKAVLLDLISERAGKPDEVQFLVNELRTRGQPLDWPEEAALLRKLRRSCPESLRPALLAIHQYESLCRPLTDAFEWILYLASLDPGRGLDAAEYVEQAPCAKLCNQIVTALREVEENELVASKWPDHGEVLTRLREIGEPSSLLPVILEHHRRAQGRKPPEGKRPWLEETARGRLIVRAPYRRDDVPAASSTYVHEYRLPTLSRFLEELGAFR